MKRQPRHGDFRANAAQNGTSIHWTPLDSEIELAVCAAEVTGCVFSGIDLMYNEHNEAIIIEVNAVPGWRSLQKTCNVDVPDCFFGWLEDTAPVT